MFYAVIVNKETSKAAFVKAIELKMIEYYVSYLDGFEILVTLYKEVVLDDDLSNGVTILDGLQGVRYEKH